MIYIIFPRDIGYVRGDIHAMDANVTNAVFGANSAIALASFMNDPSVALVVFNQRDMFEVNVEDSVINKFFPIIKIFKVL